MSFSTHRSIASILTLGALMLISSRCESLAGTPPKVIRHVIVYKEDGRFAGWPANHGIWSWGDEILVGFSRGFDKDLGPFHHIDREKPEEFLLARSRDGGATWAVETPQPPGALVGTPGMRHGLFPPGASEERPTRQIEPIDFTHADFAFTVRMEDTDDGISRYYYSYDRGKTWKGPFGLPLLGFEGVMGRTDYLVNGPDDCMLFLSASKKNGKEGRPFVARTTDGGVSWTFVATIGPEPSGYAIMPSTVRISPTELLTTIRWSEPPKSGIDAYASHDDGKTWEKVSTPEPDAGQGNPPCLLRLADGRLCLVYGYRAEPFGIPARFSKDKGMTWSAPFSLRDDGGGRDLGYVRSVIRPDGKIVSVYYYHDKPNSPRYIAATLWDPGTE